MDYGHTRGWNVRVAFESEIHSKLFSDGRYDGDRDKSFRAALRHRNKVEKSLGKPRSERWVQPSTLVPDTGIRFVLFNSRHRKGFYYEITYCATPGKISRKRVSIAKHGHKALEIAREIRRNGHYIKN